MNTQSYENIVNRTGHSGISFVHTPSSRSLPTGLNHQPLPKWAKNLVAVVGLGVASCTEAGGIKIAEMLNNSFDEPGVSKKHKS
ncbi:hypothetical protein JG687_00014343 [Phytophthora cactorum]|uniref:Uncharacterized protein n=1 Tax=Phytophthora cactorum TaxID=29920 RepID=A0A8T1TZL2_9STRA|nr:hypothetical protein JG687_00014343 [Phytophthora cactorum]